MKIFKDKHTLQKEILKTKGISFVPTMGGLHKGHISLIKKSKKSKFKTLVSIFVNPTQFNKKSDFRSYPRNTKTDLKKLKKLKINFLYIPTFKDIYGFKPKEKVFLDKFSKKLCGRFRKGHFEGVLNVVNRFIEIKGADIQTLPFAEVSQNSGFVDARTGLFASEKSLVEQTGINGITGNKFIVRLTSRDTGRKVNIVLDFTSKENR